MFIDTAVLPSLGKDEVTSITDKGSPMANKDKEVLIERTLSACNRCSGSKKAKLTFSNADFLGALGI